MRHVPLGPLAAASLLAGAGACLLLPALPGWPWLALAFASGMRIWLRGARLRWLGPALLGFGLAGLHAAMGLQQQLPVAMEGEQVEVSGRVVDLPQVEARRTRFRLLVEDGARALRGRRLQLAWYDDWGATAPGPRLQLRAGERWRMQLKLKAPRGLRNPGGFDTEKYALANRIAASGYVREPDQARRLARGRGIDAWRARMSGRIGAAVQAPSARFVRALALGDTGGLDDADWNILRANGLTHLIAISGFHVGLAAGFFALFARTLWWCWPALAWRCPRPQAAGVAALCGALVYSAVAGFALPTVRTLLMIAVVVAARLSRRYQSAADALALAAIAVLLVDPLAPLAAGFWLSFAGVAWLLWCLPQGRLHPVRAFLGAQGVATLGLLPLTVVLFGQASLAGPFANLVAVPWWSLVVVPLALLGTACEALVTGAGTWLWALSAWCFDLSWPLFERLARSPFALWWLPEARWFALPMALAGAFWLLLPRGVPGKPLALLLWLPLLWPARGLAARGDAELVMLDVGQGLSVLVRTRTHALLYDMGPKVEDGFDAGERVVVPALRALGVRRLDVAMVSHADGDHAGGLDAVRAALPVARLLGAPEDPLPETNDCLAGQGWDWDGVRFRVVHPTPHFPYLGNESSCVLRIETAHGAVLLAGDIGQVVERRLLRDDPDALRAEVVSLAHHGSKGSSDPGFVAATGARVALASAGFGNRFGHPATVVTERWQASGTRVASTADGGALRVRMQVGGPRLALRRGAEPRLWDAVRRRERLLHRKAGAGDAAGAGAAE
jgi:competence protein ComEC